MRCPGCTESLTGALCGGVCATCTAHIRRSTDAFKCRPCNALLCAECAASVQPGPDEGPARLQGRAEGEDRELLGLLQSLPDAYPMQPVMWIPKRSKQAASEIMCGLLAQAVEL